MSEHDLRHEEMDLKEDFSGMTEMTLKEPSQPPSQLPPQIDVSEAVAQAQAQSQAPPQGVSDSPDHESQEPELPGAVSIERSRGEFPPEMLAMMGGAPRPQRPSMWQTLLSRGLTIVAVLAIGVLVWLWWSRNNSSTGAADIAGAAVDVARKTVVEPIKRALGDLPPPL